MERTYDTSVFVYLLTIAILASFGVSFAIVSVMLSGKGAEIAKAGSFLTMLLGLLAALYPLLQLALKRIYGQPTSAEVSA